MKVAVVGLGLIGGSMALEVRKHGMAEHICGVDANEQNRNLALELGLADEVLDMKAALKDASLVILATPVSTLPILAAEALDLSSDRCIVVDTGSTKHQVCKALAGHPARSRFVAAHPIAGTENSGPSAAFTGLFTGKTNIICENEKSSETAVKGALELFDKLGMRTIFMDPVEHDKHAAYVSHLSHVSSFLLGRTVLDMEKDEKNIFNLAGSGFASTVRLAKSSPQMWAPIFEQNAEYLSQALVEYIMHLQKFHYCLMKKDTAGLMQIMNQANDIRRVLDGIELKQSAPQASTIKNTDNHKIE